MYLKEKRIRELMSEFNVSYRKAVTMYVPPQTLACEPVQCSPRANPSESLNNTVNPHPTPRFHNATFSNQDVPTYAQAASTSHTPKKDTTANSNQRVHKRKKKNQRKQTEENMSTESEKNGSEDSDSDMMKTKGRRDMPFFLFLKYVRQIFGDSKDSLKNRIVKVVQQVVEWAITWILQNIPNMHFFQNPFD